MSRIFCSTGTFIGRPNGRNYRLIPTLAKHFDTNGFELMLYSDWYESLPQIIDFLKDSGLSFPILHAEKGIGHLLSVGDTEQAFSNFRKNCAVAAALGSSKMVLHLWNGPSLDERIDKNLCAIKELCLIAEAHGVELTAENVVAKQGSPLEYLSRLYDATPLARFTFDTKMAAFNAELDEIDTPRYAWMWQEGAISHLHINDYAGGYMDWQNLRTMHIGQGNLDMNRFFSFIKSNFKGTMTLECLTLMPDGSYLFDEMNESLRIVRASQE
jgi:sugar phosphate isomerase/epimerase